MKKEIVVITNKFDYITGYIGCTKISEGLYNYKMIDHNGIPYDLGCFTTEQLAKVTKLETEDNTYDYTALV